MDKNEQDGIYTHQDIASTSWKPNGFTDFVVSTLQINHNTSQVIDARQQLKLILHLKCVA
jgi:lipopolysaccharide export system protein LptC